MRARWPGYWPAGPLARGGAAPGPTADAIRALAVAVPFAALADTFLGASRGFRNMLPTVVVDRITRPAVQVAGLIAAVAVGRAALLAPLWALPYLPASLAAWLWLRRTRLRPRPAARPAPALRPDRATAPPVPWAMPAHPSSPPARHWTLSAQPGTPPAGLAPPPTAGTEGRSAQPATRHGQGWPGTLPARPGLQEVPPALAVLLALSRPVPPPSPVTRPPDDHPGAPTRPGIPVAPGWTRPVRRHEPEAARAGSGHRAAGRFPPRPRPARPSPEPGPVGSQVPGRPGDPAKPPPPQAAGPGAPWPADAPPGHAAAPGPPREPITQPFWFPGEPGLPWNEVPPPPGLAVPGPPWAPAAPPPGRGLPAPDLAERDGAGNAAGFWRFTVPRGLAALAQITIQRVDIVLVAVLRGPAAAAVYTAATRFLVAGQFGNQAIAMAAQPRLTEMFTVGDRAAANGVYQATTAWLILLTWPLYLLAVAFGPQVIEVFGRSYSAGPRRCVILGLTMLLATGCGQVDMVLVTTGRSSWSLANGLLAVAVNVGLDLALIPAYGITGAAIGWSAAIALTNLLPLAQIAATQRCTPSAAAPPSPRPCPPSASACCRCWRARWPARRPPAALAAIGYGCGAMAVGMWCFRDRTPPGGPARPPARCRRRDEAQRTRGVRLDEPSSSGSVLMFKASCPSVAVGILAILVLTALSVKRWARGPPRRDERARPRCIRAPRGPRSWGCC